MTGEIGFGKDQGFSLFAYGAMWLWLVRRSGEMGDGVAENWYYLEIGLLDRHGMWSELTGFVQGASKDAGPPPHSRPSQPTASDYC